MAVRRQLPQGCRLTPLAPCSFYTVTHGSPRCLGTLTLEDTGHLVRTPSRRTPAYLSRGHPAHVLCSLREVPLPLETQAMAFNPTSHSAPGFLITETSASMMTHTHPTHSLSLKNKWIPPERSYLSLTFTGIQAAKADVTLVRRRARTQALVLSVKLPPRSSPVPLLATGAE